MESDMKLKFPIDGCWCDMQDGRWYESGTDTVWRKTPDGWVKVG
jgi:hypothetical protein